MIFDQAIAQSCGFCLQGGVQVFSAEGLERRFVIFQNHSGTTFVYQAGDFGKILICFGNGN